MAYPEEKPKKIWAQLLKLFKGSDNLEIPAHDQTQADCLLIFLEQQSTVLGCLDFSTESRVNFVKCVNDIYAIYKQLRVQGLCINEHSISDTRVAKELPKVCMYMFNGVF